MSLTSVTFIGLARWVLKSTIAGFAQAAQDDPGQNISLGGVDLTKFGQLRATNYSIPVGQFFDFDLYSFVDLLNNQTGFTVNGALSLLVKAVVGTVNLDPSPNNGLQWFFRSATLGVTLTPGGGMLFSLPPAGPGQVVTPTSRNLRVTNADVVPATGYFIAVGG